MLDMILDLTIVHFFISKNSDCDKNAIIFGVENSSSCMLTIKQRCHSS